MAFWGVEVTPTRRHLHRFDPTLGRLHISQATLGNGTSQSQNKSVLQCNVGDKAPILLCCLMPDKTECCSLNLEFQEDGVDVIFSVVGPRSIHLAGYYYNPISHSHAHGDDESDSYGEDIADTETDHSNDDYDTDDSFIDDTEFIPSPKSLARPKRLKKKYQVSDSDSDAHIPIILGGSTSIFHSDTDTDTHDQDSFPISTLSNKKHISVKKIIKDEDVDADADGQLIGAKRKSQDSLDGDTERGIEIPNESSLPNLEVVNAISEKRKKKKKKEHTKEGKTPGVVDGSMIDVDMEDKAQKQAAQMDDITLEEPVSDERRSPDKEVEKANKSCHSPTAEYGSKKKGKKKRANVGNTQGVGADNVHVDDKAQMQEEPAVGITNDDYVIDAVAAAGGKKKKKKNKKKAGDEPASEEEPRKETDKGRIGGRKKQK